MLLRLAGVGDEEITDGVITKTKRRFNWLLVKFIYSFFSNLLCISLIWSNYRTNGSFSFS